MYRGRGVVSKPELLQSHRKDASEFLPCHIKGATIHLPQKPHTPPDHTNGDDTPVLVADSLSVFYMIGCTATHSAGSSVLFATEDGGISVHKKHPDPTVDPIMLQAIGGRVRMWLAWTEARFVLNARFREDDTIMSPCKQSFTSRLV